MCDQVNLFAPEFTEEGIYNLLYPELKKIMDANQIGNNHLKFNIMKDYSSVMIDSYLAFRIYKRDKKHFFEFPASLANLAGSNIRIVEKRTKSEIAAGFVKAAFDSMEEVSTYTAFLCALLDAAIDRIPKEYDCCAYYATCSDAKCCTNPDKDFAMGCGYKRIMKKGKVFYGKNRNV